MEGGLGMDPQKASLIYGFFTGFVYFTPLIGGWLADNIIGQQRAITIGGITMMLGQFALFAWNNEFGLYTGLFLLIIGNGFFKPNISTMVGQLYKPGDPMRDSAFTIFYMGINLGAFFAPLVVGTVSDKWFSTTDESGNILSYGYKYGFLAAGIGMLIGQVIFNLVAVKQLGDIGKYAFKKNSSIDSSAENVPFTKEHKDRMIVIFILTAFVIFFWAGFEQAGSSLSLYTDKYIDRKIGEWEIPTSFFQSVNPLFIVALAPLFAAFWVSKIGKKISTPIKIGLGMILLGVGFFFMLGAVAERGGDVKDETIKASLIWLILTYLIHTIGELCLSPVGLSVVTKLSHPKYASLMMGVWLLSSFVANILGGFVSASVESLGATAVFSSISIFVISLGLIVIILNKKLLEMMHGIF
jgi:POT family proton-dependent oligopeptide transporter